MKNPYSVLGISDKASVDEVKKAYRELAKKYHPDNYINNPLADLAEEKMKEINEAYDSIIKEIPTPTTVTGKLIRILQTRSMRKSEMLYHRGIFILQKNFCRNAATTMLNGIFLWVVLCFEKDGMTMQGPISQGHTPWIRETENTQRR